jgi:alpha-L-fucosidase 2
MELIGWLLMASAALDLVSAKELWSSKPASYTKQGSAEYLLRTGYPVGNGKLGGEAFHLIYASMR